MGGFELAAAGAALGAIAGSFIGVLYVRLPSGTPFVGGRSKCDACGAVLTFVDLVPILSFAALRGRCRHCGAKIAPELLLIEVLAAAIGAAAFALADTPGEVLWALFGWTLLLLAALDLKHYWLPASVTALLAVAGAVAVALNVGDVANAAIGGVAGYASLALLRWGYRAARGRDGMGAGDPRLFGAIGIWTGWEALPFIAVGAAGTGLILALYWSLRGAKVTGATRVPLGTSLAIAAITVWLAVATGVFGGKAINLAAL